MKAGRLRHVVDVQRATEATNDFGEPIQTWITLGTAHAAIMPIAGQERFAAQVVNAEVSHRLLMRYYAGLTPKDRLKYGDRVFNVSSVTCRDEKRHEMEVFCTEQV